MRQPGLRGQRSRAKLELTVDGTRVPLIVVVAPDVASAREPAA